MIRALMQKLGLDRIGEVGADEARQVRTEVLREERGILAGMIGKLDGRPPLPTYGGGQGGPRPLSIRRCA